MTQESEFLLRSLRDLEAEKAAGDISVEDYDALRDDYTARAAAALREDPAPTPAKSRRPWLIGAAIIVVAIVAGLAVANAAGQRLPSDAATGSIDTGISGQLALARQHIADGQAVEALKVYDRILRADPRHAEALAYRGWLVRLAGLPDDGLRYVDRAIAADPSYADAHFFRAMILWKDKQDPAAAVPEFRAFLANNPPPDRVAAVEAVLKQAEAEASAKSP